MEPSPATNSRAVGATVAGCAALIFLFAYAGNPMRPGQVYPMGWYGWHDQGEYLNMLRSIAQGTLGRFTYPLGYPVLAWLFGWIMPDDPFVPLDLLLFTGFVWCSWRIMDGLLLSQGVRLMAAFALAMSWVRFFVEPWSSSLSAASLALILYVCLCRKPWARWGALAGTAVAVMFAARLVDALVGGCAVAAAIFEAWRRDKRPPVAFAAAAAISCAVLSAAVMAVNLHFTGSPLGNYYEMARGQGLSGLAAIGFKLYGYFFDSLVFAHESLAGASSVWMMFPIMLAAPAGLMLLWRRRRAAVTIFLSTLVGWACAYVPFPAVSGLTLRFGSARYIGVLAPILTAAGAVVVAEFAAGRVRMRYTAVYVATLAALAALPLALRTHKIFLSASQIRACCNQDDIALAVDGDAGTSWTSGTPRRAGMSLTIDAGRVFLFQRLKLEMMANPAQGPGPVTFDASRDGEHWRPLAFNDTSVQAGVSDYYTDPDAVRYVRLKVLTDDPVNPWSIQELSLYGF